MVYFMASVFPHNRRQPMYLGGTIEVNLGDRFDGTISIGTSLGWRFYTRQSYYKDGRCVDVALTLGPVDVMGTYYSKRKPVTAAIVPGDPDLARKLQKAFDETTIVPAKHVGTLTGMKKSLDKSWGVPHDQVTEIKNATATNIKRS